MPALRHIVLVLTTIGDGELVADQYEVQGCIAHGGVG